MRGEIENLRFSLDRAIDPNSVTVTPAAPQPPLIVPEVLVRASSAGECVLVTGGGLAAQAGLPTWTELLATFLSHLEAVDQQADWALVRNQVLKGDHSLAYDLLESRRKLGALQESIVDDFGKKVEVPSWLSDFFGAVPLAGVLTITPDNLVERAARRKNPLIFAYDASTDFSRLIRDRQFFVGKLYGDLSSPKKLIVTAKQYGSMLDDMPELKTFIASLFSSKHLLFVGISPDGILDFLEATGIRQSGSLTHYALVPERSDLPVLQERFQSKYDITLLRYRPTSGFPEVPRFLGQLEAAVERQRTEQPHSQSFEATLVPSKLESLRLNNIGPFREAAFDFRNPWTILLGNNGSGKSTVLKAIALALSGEDEKARSYSRQLLRSGAASGTIEIKVGAITYRTTIRNVRGRVEVKADQIPPLKAGTLVALGFPAVRGVTRPGVTTTDNESYPYPRVEDVIPLLAGGADERVANLKSWIINTWVKTQTVTVQSQRARLQAMLDQFFKFLDELTPGFDLSLNSCDVDNQEVILDTADGPLSLDFVSQGMSSTIGWVGVLFQRLLDIYKDSGTPESEAGLLLIDEIDSHLHPEWQRLLCPKVKQLFPKLQVIATTHSPLMVANSEAGELMRIQRDGAELTVEPITISLEGYRADQILTTNAFGLTTTRGVKTEERRKRYAELLGRIERSSQEEAEFKTIEQELEAGPRAGETPAGRSAANLLDAQLRMQIEKAVEKAEGDKEALLGELEKYAAKVKSGG
ncbi:AAA family ATPase [Bradyrhizobium sp. PUT101]|uniref:AAA family ATPase n=1 Tax=Bradyrhizobium sp. PUT101 TaxID=3447427 RepID=UPI003F843F92